MNSQRFISILTTPFLIYLLLFSNVIFSADSKSLTQQRIQYTNALDAYKKKDTKTADQLTKKLQSYPLYPYLQLKQFRRNINKASSEQLLAFMKTHKDSNLAKKAQAIYLQKLANQKNWSSYKKQYLKTPLTSAYYKCYFLQAQINTKQGKKALASVSELWNVGYSQPKSCDPVFAFWKSNGKLSSNLLFERTWKAINNKKYKFAKHLQKQIKNSRHQNSLNLFWKIQKDVSLISHPKTLNKNTLHNNDIAAYAIRKLAIKKGDLALKSWLRDRKRFPFTKDQRQHLNVYFGNKFAKSTFYQPSALATLQKIDPKYKYDEISEWKVRQALISQNWQSVVTLIKKMPSQLQQQNRWIYWLEVAKQKKAPKTYKANFKKIIAERDYYSFMAAHTTGKTLQLNDQSQNIDPKITQSLKKLKPVKRMKELVHFGETSSAYQEWRVVNKQLNEKQALALGYIVNSWGWYIQGIRIAAKLKAWNELDIRFPKAKNKLFSELATSRKIDQTWPIAIARQESAYNQYAQSSAGARGFMQLMPATAKTTAKKHKVAYKNKNDLFDPRTNISLGTAYLSEMLNKFGNKAYASAAYNAGPHRVERWLKSRGTLPLDIWIETIPFNETRHYVENILTYSAIYNLLEKKKSKILNKKDTSNLTLNRT